MSFRETKLDVTADYQEPVTADLQDAPWLEPQASEDGAAPDALLTPFYPDLLVEESDVRCSICLSVWHKPCVTGCGHVFCFWCLHLAMNGLGPSQCPLCRAPYGHLPSICLPLHHFVAQQFPADFHRRAQEVAAEEALVGVASPVLPPAPSAGALAKGFDCGYCGRLAVDPSVARCGHVFCHRCVAERVSFADVACPVDHCLGVITSVSAPCLALHHLLQLALPGRYAALPQLCGAKDPHTPVTPLSPLEGEPPPRSRPESPLQPFSPIEQLEAAEQDQAYVHFGIICDGCGAYPIVGNRWRCCDCTERIGFDICGECYNRQVHRQRRTGKFNQSHRPHHRLQLVEQVDDWLHRLKALHPGLPLPQLLSLVALAMEGVHGSIAPEAGDEAGSPRPTVDVP